MIVVAIIGILAAIAIPAYQNYTKNASEKACLAEVKGVANQHYVLANDPEGDESKDAAGIAAMANACESIALATESNVTTITGTPKNPVTSTNKAVCTLDDPLICEIK